MSPRSLRPLVAGIAVLVLALSVGPATSAQADPPAQPAAVSVPGSFGAQVGCPGDWQPDCANVALTRRANDDVWSTSLPLNAGSYEYKAALDNTWDVSYGVGGAPGGANITLVVPAGGATVTFYYDNATHWVTADVSTPIVTAAGSFQSELGCPADWSPDCLRSWLEDLDGDGTYTFTTTDLPAGSYQTKATVGLTWDVNYGAGGQLGGANIDFAVPADGTATTFSFVSATHVLTVTSGHGPPSLKQQRAFWLSKRDIAWNAAGTDVASYRLYSAPDGGLAPVPDGITGGTSIELAVNPAGLPADVKSRFPAQAGLTALRIPEGTPVKAMLTGQVTVAAFDADGNLLDATGLQIPGVLDASYPGAAHRSLGLRWSGRTPKLSLWAPTAKSVALNVYPSGADSAPAATVPLTRSSDGVWSVTGSRSWKGKYFLFDVRVYVPETDVVEHNLVTDPYSLGLSTNSARSLFLDLDDSALSPRGWQRLAKPALPKAVDQSITELHIRDFSVSDPTVPAVQRGTYEAFTATSINAVKHLRALAKAGLTTVHLLPSFDISTINEDKSTWQTPACDLPALPPDSDQQQACVTAIAAQDGYNWGYDPLHYTTPEGSYATNPEGSTRTREFRDMVAALNKYRLRVVTDVVYNHTTDSGQSGKNDLDRIVPGYYHRLNATGAVETSTCCANTATEHTMMGKLLIDSVLTWAKDYKVDGFRFDLMGHQPKSVMLALRKALDKLTVHHDGVNGKQIYLYGEGWNFGEVANDALFVQATQANMAGTGIGTFNDRIRDAVRGGGPFDDDPRIQGYASGLYTDFNGDPANGTTAEQRARLLLSMDQLKVGLTGNLKGYTFTDRTGALVTGAQVDYNGQPAGYASSPQDTINYVDAHDNETLYDALTYKLPQATSMADRIRMQTLALSTTAFSQGVSFWQAGSEALRSKSFDGNSYDSGDWFNVLDPSLQTNGFARGLPSNQAKWPYSKPLLADAALNPNHADLVRANAQSEALLTIRAAYPLLHLGSAALIQQKLSFPGSGPSQTPGVIVMRLDDTVGPNVDKRRNGMVIVFNATPQATTQTVAATAGKRFSLSPIQAHGGDPVVRTATFTASTGSFTVPARTVAVFVSP